MEQILKKILEENRRIGIPEDLINRDTGIREYLKLKPPKVIVISGFRRVGKTYLCFQEIRDMGIENSCYINLEDERLPERTETLTELSRVIPDFRSKKLFLFVDEIQNIPNWSKWVRRMYDNERFNIQLIITGSSSKLSSKEIPTELRGRCMNTELFPLSFLEFLKFKGIEMDSESLSYSDSERNKVLKVLEEYLKYGGMPEIVNYDVRKKAETIKEYIKLAISRDIVERYKIRKRQSVDVLIKLLLNSTYFTYSKLYKSLRGEYEIGKGSIIRYVEYIKTSYLIFEIQQIHRKVKPTLKSPRKVYFIDNSFITFLSLKFSENFGRLMENLVAIELQRRKSQASFDLYYWKDYQGKEVDFVLKEDLRVKELIQVCYDVGDFETKERELKALVKASKELRCDNLRVITWDYEAKEEVKGKKIKFMPLWKWLLE